MYCEEKRAKGEKIVTIATDPLALSLWSLFKICFPVFRYHKREGLSHTGNFDTGHFHVGRVRVRERPPRGEREREEDRDGDQSLSAFQFARSKNGGEREGSVFAFAMPSRPSSDSADNHLISQVMYQQNDLQLRHVFQREGENREDDALSCL